MYCLCLLIFLRINQFYDFCCFGFPCPFVRLAKKKRSNIFMTFYLLFLSSLVIFIFPTWRFWGSRCFTLFSYEKTLLIVHVFHRKIKQQKNFSSLKKCLVKMFDSRMLQLQCKCRYEVLFFYSIFSFLNLKTIKVNSHFSGLWKHW